MVLAHPKVILAKPRLIRFWPILNLPLTVLAKPILIRFWPTLNLPLTVLAKPILIRFWPTLNLPFLAYTLLPVRKGRVEAYPAPRLVFMRAL
jgi:hypothetical protein